MTSPLKAELAGIQATLDASLQREREANERIATLEADLSARMSQLNEARAATVDCNMALMELAAIHANCDDTRDEAINAETEACARLVDATDDYGPDALSRAAAAIRSRKS